jgi:hypothetical protein
MDQGGPIRKLAEYLPLLAMGKETFLRSYWTPVLLITAPKTEPAGPALATHVLDAAAVRSAMVKRSSEMLVVSVVKRQKDAFQNYIWVGREGGCDVTIPFDGVSKLQAQFIRKPDGTYELLDAGSTNGTFVNGVGLDPKKSALVRNGAELRFGQLTATFLTAEGFWKELQELSGAGGPAITPGMPPPPGQPRKG